MAPNDQRADVEDGLGQRAARQGDAIGAAIHLTAAAHLTTAQRPTLRGMRAVDACRAWGRAGRKDWERRMALSFAHDRCIAPGPKRMLRRLAAGGPGLGRTFPAGSPAFVRLRPQDIGRQIHFRVQPEGSIRTWEPWS